jgi:hypothetical protein
MDSSSFRSVCEEIISTLELGRGLGWFATVPVPFST